MPTIISAKLLNHPLWDSQTVQHIVKASLAAATVTFLASVILCTFATSIAIPVALPIALCTLGSVVALTSCAFIAIKGHSNTQYQLARKYEEGSPETPVDDAKAFELYTKAAEFGHTEAQFRLAQYYFFGKGCSADVNKSRELIHQAAVKGLPIAQLTLSDWLITGSGCEKNIVEGYQIAEKLANKGFPAAQFSLALLYDNQPLSEITKCDPSVTTYSAAREAAKKFYTQVANAKVIDTKGLIDRETNFFFRQAQYELAIKYEQEKTLADHVKAFELYTEAAKSGHPEAQFRLAKFYFIGKGCNADQNKSLELIDQAASHKLLIAQAVLADCYLKGLSGEENVVKGFNALRQLSDDGFFPAKFLLANFYYNLRIPEINKCDPSVNSSLESDLIARKLFNEVAKVNEKKVNGLTSDEANEFISGALEALDSLSMYND